MSSFIRRIVFNTRERIASDDFRVATDLQHRALIEGLSATLGKGINYTGVISGFTVAPASGLTVTVQPGMALRNDGAAPTAYDSAIDWIESTQSQNIDLASYVNGALNRWVCIHITPSDAVELSSLRDVWDPINSVGVPTTVEKVRTPLTVFGISIGGLFAGTPELPIGVTGAIPLAYVYMAAGATSLSLSDVFMCRPLLGREVGDAEGEFKGGGISSTVRGPTVTLNRTTAKFPEETLVRSVSAFEVDTSVATHRSDGYTYPPASTGIIYAYLAKPPFPTGYTNLSPNRELYSLIPSTRIPSANSCRNCVFFFSGTPTQSTVTPQGRPTNAHVLLDPTWGSEPITLSNAVYIGSARIVATSGVIGIQQTVGDLVRIKNANTLDPDAIYESDVFTVSGAGNIGNFRMSDPLSASGNTVLPSSVSEVVAFTRHSTSVSGTSQFEVEDGINTVHYNSLPNGTTVGGSYAIQNPAGTFEYAHVVSGGGEANVAFHVLAYKDPMLSARR